MSKTQDFVESINLSKHIEKAVNGEKVENKILHKQASKGRKQFYIIVFAGLLIGFIFSACEYFNFEQSVQDVIQEETEKNLIAE